MNFLMKKNKNKKNENYQKYSINQNNIIEK